MTGRDRTTLTGAGGETLVKLQIAEALQGKKIYLLPVSEGGINLKTTDINDLLKIYGLKSMAQKAPLKPEPAKPAKK